GLLVAHLGQRLPAGGPLERGAAGEALVEDGPQGAHVGGRPDHGAGLPRLLGGHVAGRPEDGAGLSRPVPPVEQLGQPEVRHLDGVAVEHVSANGSVVVGYSGDEAFIWGPDDAHTGPLQDILTQEAILTSDSELGDALKGWQLTSATAV